MIGIGLGLNFSSGGGIQDPATPASASRGIRRRSSFGTASLAQAPSTPTSRGRTGSDAFFSPIVGTVLQMDATPLDPALTVEGDSAAGASAAENPPQSILKLFSTVGNPLHFMTSVSEESTEAAGSGEAKVTRSGSEDEGSGSSYSYASEFLTMLTEEDEMTTGKGGRRAQDQTGSMVVTQTALNGLARYAGRYLQMMYLLPCAAPDIFVAICQMFDYYLCVVFTGFVPPEERQKVLTRQSRMTAPAPDQCGDFEVGRLASQFSIYLCCCAI